MIFESIVADSSFYLCFLEDINKPADLKTIAHKIHFFIGPTVFGEVCRKDTNAKFIQECSQIRKIDTPYNYDALLRLLFSKNEIEKGEAEVIALAYIMSQSGEIEKFILDDQCPRKFVERNLKDLAPIMKGTVGFIGDCYCDFLILYKKESLDLLQLIGNSRFRVTEGVTSGKE